MEHIHNIEITALKGSLVQVTKELIDIKASITSSPVHWLALHSSTATPGSRSTINDLAAELKLRESKKLNIIIHGLPVSQDDSVLCTVIVDNELGLKPYIQSVKRHAGNVTTPSTKPVTLRIAVCCLRMPQSFVTALVR